MKLSYPSPVANLQAASAVPQLIRASKTFTGAANLGATGANELFTTTGVVFIDGFYVRCTSTLVDSVDGALFALGVTGATKIFTGTGFEGAFDLDTINTGDGLAANQAVAFVGYAPNLANDITDVGGGVVQPMAIFANIIMTISAQAITGGVLEFYILYRPLSSGAGLALGAGMTQI